MKLKHIAISIVALAVLTIAIVIYSPNQTDAANVNETNIDNPHIEAEYVLDLPVVFRNNRGIYKVKDNKEGYIIYILRTGNQALEPQMVVVPDRTR